MRAPRADRQCAPAFLVSQLATPTLSGGVFGGTVCSPPGADGRPSTSGHTLWIVLILRSFNVTISVGTHHKHPPRRTAATLPLTGPTWIVVSRHVALSPRGATRRGELLHSGFSGPILKTQVANYLSAKNERLFLRRIAPLKVSATGATQEVSWIGRPRLRGLPCQVAYG